MKTYSGSCHCGAVTFKIEADISSALSCNCSHCQAKGMLLTFVPEAQFTLLSGEDNLTEYLFNKKAIAHQFCKTCGVQPFAFSKDADGNDTAAINVRCLPEVDIEALEIQKYNGKDV